MQPTVIPFELKFRWFVVSMLILMFVMFVIQYLMKRWNMWRKNIIGWMKTRELESAKDGEIVGSGSDLAHDDIPGCSV